MSSVRTMILSAVLAFPLAYNASAATSDVVIGGGGGSYSSHRVRSLLEMRFVDVVHQHYDFSCGSAALATLLTYHYQQPIDERDVLKAMFENGEPDKIRKEGFSMLDMKNYLASIGYHAEGFRETLDKLGAVGIPAIVLLNRKGYRHFVVVKGVTRDKVLVGDSSLGLRVEDRRDFERMWNGILFVVMDHMDIARASFNSQQRWHAHGTPFLRNMLDQGSLDRLTIDTSITPNYY